MYFLFPVQLLHKLNVRAADGNMKLMKVIRNPVTDYLPVGCKKIGTSFTSKKLVNSRDLAPTDQPIVIVIGAMAHGKVSPFPWLSSRGLLRDAQASHLCKGLVYMIFCFWMDVEMWHKAKIV